MGRAIDAEVFANKLIEICPDLRKLSTKTIGIALAQTPTIEEIMAVNSEHAKGHWERPEGVSASSSSYRYQCSNCGGIAFQVTGHNARRYKTINECTYKFCPNCGADMRGN